MRYLYYSKDIWQQSSDKLTNLLQKSSLNKTTSPKYWYFQKSLYSKLRKIDLPAKMITILQKNSSDKLSSTSKAGPTWVSLQLLIILSY